jgi:hypothetical protein
MPVVDRLTPQVEDIILTAMRRGCTYRVAATAAGVSQQTIFHWLRLGRRSKSGKFLKFLKSLRQVQAQALAACAARVMDAVNAGDIRAAQWFLERRAPEDYGPLPVKELDRRLAALEKALAVDRDLAGARNRLPEEVTCGSNGHPDRCVPHGRGGDAGPAPPPLGPG